MDARSAAIAALVEVFAAGRSLGVSLPPALLEVADPRDRALAQDLCYGVLRWWPRLEAVAAVLVRRPLKGRDTDLHCVILAALYQLIHTRIPPHAAVDEAVSLVVGLGKPWARGLVNAVLRRFQRERQAILAQVDRDEATALAHPRWLFDRIRAAWPDDWRRIAQSNNERPPMCLRVNRLRGGRDDYLHELAAAGIAAAVHPHGTEALVIERPVDVERLPGFSTGRVSVQDAAAQLAAGLLAARPGERILDACAAPGGKTAHILERQPELEALVALDRDAARLQRVRENLARLDLAATLVNGDAGAPEDWWDRHPFDRILLDAPCSGSGVIRRHPDIKRLRRDTDIAPLVAQQERLLEAAWTMLKAGGVLLYSTCSIIPEENDGQIARFLARHSDAVARRLEARWGRAVSAGRQILPGEDGMDGFYYACMDKLPHA
ncbi:MAG: 16S rRNA (cytosine(967)-C(5))-methyltransferase RsmB [Gammaproteobacteria bacterium]|nr:16S rRNA (cytosine(967)-C(5))-methyltransferase RsmB [Gammaproteobacteria bacterium]